MKSTIKSTLFCAFALSLLGACSGGTQTESAPGSSGSSAPKASSGDSIEVIIGTANALTGPFAHWGQDASNGVRLAVNEANARNPVWNGKKVFFKVMSEDDQGDPKTAGQVAQRFVDKGAKVVVGHLTTGPSKVASRIYNDNGVPEIVYSVTGNDFMDQGYPMLFRVMASDKDQGLKLAQYAVDKLGMKTFIDVNDKTPYGEGLANDFVQSATKLGAKHIATEYTTNSATEFGAIVTNIKKNNPDVVFYGGMDAQAAPLVREMRKQGVNAKFIGADGIFTPKFIELSADAGVGSYSSATGSDREIMPGFKEFNEKYQNAFHQEVNQYSPYAYDATNIIINAMNEAQSAEAKDYVPFVKKTNYTGVTGQISFKENGDIANPIVTIYTLQDGKWQVVKDAATGAEAAPAAEEAAPAEAPAAQ